MEISIEGEVYHLSNDKFTKYRKNFIKWQRVLSCDDFYVDFYFDELDSDTLAATSVCSQQMTAATTLNSTWSDLRPTDVEIDRLALHEALEVRLCELRLMACESKNYDIVDAAVHRVIRSLETYFFRRKK